MSGSDDCPFRKPNVHDQAALSIGAMAPAVVFEDHEAFIAGSAFCLYAQIDLLVSMAQFRKVAYEIAAVFFANQESEITNVAIQLRHARIAAVVFHRVAFVGVEHGAKSRYVLRCQRIHEVMKRSVLDGRGLAGQRGEKEKA